MPSLRAQRASTAGCCAAATAACGCGAAANATSSTTPATYPTSGPKTSPPTTPPTVYLNETRLNDAIFESLRGALFGPERTAYWQRCLAAAAAEPEQTASAAERIKEVNADIADLERRLDRQLLNLEADDVTPALRRRVNQRVTQLEDAITERRQRLDVLATEAATEAPKLADVAPLLEHLPILAEKLADMPHRELRALLDSLQLEIVYQPADTAVDVTLTLL
jgi:hypothetical protein